MAINRIAYALGGTIKRQEGRYPWSSCPLGRHLALAREFSSVLLPVCLPTCLPAPGPRTAAACGLSPWVGDGRGGSKREAKPAAGLLWGTNTPLPSVGGGGKSRPIPCRGGLRWVCAPVTTDLLVSGLLSFAVHHWRKQLFHSGRGRGLLRTLTRCSGPGPK